MQHSLSLYSLHSRHSTQCVLLTHHMCHEVNVGDVVSDSQFHSPPEKANKATLVCRGIHLRHTKTITIRAVCYRRPLSVKPMSLPTSLGDTSLLRAEETMTVTSRGSFSLISSTRNPSHCHHRHHDESESNCGGSLEQKLQLIALHRMAALEHCARYVSDLEASMELIGREEANSGCTPAASPSGGCEMEHAHCAAQQGQQRQQPQQLQQAPEDRACRSRRSAGHSMQERSLRKERRMQRRQFHSMHMDGNFHCFEQSQRPPYLADLTYYNATTSLQQRQPVSAVAAGNGWRLEGGGSGTPAAREACSSPAHSPTLAEEGNDFHQRRNVSAEARFREWK